MAFPWSHKSPVDASPAGYARWLRAYRPPLDWFLRLSELEQEALAQVGDSHAIEAAVVVAEVAADPATAADVEHARAGDVESEVSLAQQLIRGLAQQVTAGRRPAAGPPQAADPNDVPGTTTAAGFGSRRSETTRDSADRPAEALASLTGRAPEVTR